MRIAGDKTDLDWDAFKTGLVSGESPDLWEEAFEVYFSKRLKTRYFKPIQLLRAKRNAEYEGEGFAIVTIQCSLIEFLETTVQGISFRLARTGDPPLGPFEYGIGHSGAIFRSFLRNRQPFPTVFTNDSLADDFYSSVRCGLLHEARTKSPWIIRAGGPEGMFVEITPAEKIIYRNRFQDALQIFIMMYKADLLSNPATQDAFVRKFNSLCI
ncbi:MAG: hypothetical protein K8L99_04545 [Anaerolineae bacterium]|nr:hypothetical protein [Anaerolineae bacterium]